MEDFAQAKPMSGRAQPSREAIEQEDRLRLLNHPLTASLITILRDISSASREFAWAVAELTRQLLWCALENEEVEHIKVRGFSGEPIDGSRLLRQPALLAIMRAGLGMVPPARAVLPNVSVYQIGVKRDERTLEPNMYYSNLPESYDGTGHLLILDPMLATGGSACAALREVRKHFDGTLTFIGLLGAPFGVARLLQADPRVRIVLAALDERLDDRGYILPGLGDAGDRLFGTSSS